MIKRACCLLFLVVCLGGWSGGGLAAAVPAADGQRDPAAARAHFSAGAQASRQGDFGAALEAFLAARDAGLDSPAVHYNIGVCAWELGKLELAETAFQAAAGAPGMAALAQYNLGLVSLRRGEEQAARTRFLLARDASDDPRLQQLASTQLERLDAVPGDGAARRRTLMFLSAQAGYDDNVVLRDDSALLGISDTGSAFAEAQAALSAPLRDRLSLEGDAFLLRYAELDQFDQAGAQLDLLYRPRLGRWSGELGAGYRLDQLDGERFEDRRKLLLGASRTLDERWDVRLRYRFEDVDGGDGFESLSGRWQEASVRLRRRDGPGRLRLEYRLELNDRDDEAVSPDRHRAELEWTTDLPWRAELALAGAWRYSSYSRPQQDERSERQTQLSAALLGPISGGWEWALRYDWTRNSTSLETFAYTRHRVHAGIQRIF